MSESAPGSSKEPIKPRTKDPLEAGRYVTVERSPESGGGLDSGFKITYFDEINGMFVVQKTENGKVTTKRIPIKELEELNSPK